MAEYKLTTEAKEAIRQGEVFGKISEAIDVSPFTLPDLVRKNSPKLTQASVLNIISEATGIEPMNLVEEVKEPIEING